jgi:PTH2 family peptidyl-tRNA hydrolase
MYKQVIIVRRDLKLDKGKLASQVAHASLEAYKKSDPSARKNWEEEGAKKVILKVKNLKELKEIYKKIRKERIPCSLIRDAGKTQLKPGTITVLGIGPCESERVDKITKDLKLL